MSDEQPECLGVCTFEDDICLGCGRDLNAPSAPPANDGKAERLGVAPSPDAED